MVDIFCLRSIGFDKQSVGRLGKSICSDLVEPYRGVYPAVLGCKNAKRVFNSCL
jgi:hypothetical protein